jgi:hypothetical protein
MLLGSATIPLAVSNSTKLLYNSLLIFFSIFAFDLYVLVVPFFAYP